MNVIFDKLPPYYKSKELFSKIIEQVIPAKVMLSFILYEKDGKEYSLKKDGTMHAPLDWQTFSIMRALAKLLIVTGKTIRAQKGLYLRRQSYGDQHVQELYQALLGKTSQKLIVLTNSMTKHQLQQEVNPHFYELMDLPQCSSMAKFFQKISTTSQGPVLIENGITSIENYFNQVLQGSSNVVDMIMLSRFSGSLPEQYIGEESRLPIEALYKKTWESQQFPCILPGNIQGNLRFTTYSL